MPKVLAVLFVETRTSQKPLGVGRLFAGSGAKQTS
jgi:hypothetical protein